MRRLITGTPGDLWKKVNAEVGENCFSSSLVSPALIETWNSLAYPIIKKNFSSNAIYSCRISKKREKIELLFSSLCSSCVFRSFIMSQKASDKKFLLHPIENRRNASQASKNASVNPLPTQHSATTNTVQLQLNRDIGTNTPNYTEQMSKAIENGRSTDQVVGMLLEGTSMNA